MKIALFLLPAMLLQAPAHAQVAYEQSHHGHIELHNQVEYHTIPLYAGQGNLRVLTDSYTSTSATPVSNCLDSRTAPAW